MVRAGTAETRPADEIQLAATATVIMMVLSIMPNGRLTMPAPSRPLNTAYITMTAAMSTPSPHPDLSPM